MHVCACEFVGVAAGALGLILSMDGAEPGEATGDGLEQLGAAWSKPGATEETTDKIDKGTDSAVYVAPQAINACRSGTTAATGRL